MIPGVQESLLKILLQFIVKQEFTDCYSYGVVGNVLVGSSAVPLFSIPINGDYNFSSVKTAINGGCNCWIIDQSLALKFIPAFGNIVQRNEMQRPIRPKLLFSPSGDSESQSFKLNQEIVNLTVIWKIPDIILIIPSNDPSNYDFDLLTSTFIGIKDVHKISVINSVKIEGFDKVQFKWSPTIDLYRRDNLKNLQQGYVTLATIQYPPYSFYNKMDLGKGNSIQQTSIDDPNPEKSIFLDGTESLMAIEFCKRFNCTLVFLPEDGNLFGDVYENYTGNGIVGAVAGFRAEIGYGALCMWYNEYHYMDFSNPVSRTGITAVVPKPKVADAIWIAVFPFTASLWIVIILSLIIESLTTIFIQSIINKLTATKTPISPIAFNVIQLHILQSAEFNRSSLSQRLIWTTILIGGFIIGNCYSGSLASFIIIPRFETPIEPSVMAAKRIPWAANHNAWTYSINLSTSPQPVAIRESFQVHSTEDMMLIPPGEMSYAVERLPYNNFAFGDHIKRDTMSALRVMKEDIYYDYAIWAIRKGWYMKGYLDHFILRVIESGIQKYWLIETINKQLDPSVQQSIVLSNRVHETTATSLTIEEVEGVFCILGIGYGISIVVFIVEVLIRYCKK